MAPQSRFALVVAHPGHELRVFHWLERHRPVYCCLTDGSGGRSASRLASTTSLLDRLGARVGPIYGRYSDRDLYALLLSSRTEPLVDLARELADLLVTSGVVVVAGDSAEGFNPAHDVCRFAIDAAVAAARRRGAPIVENLEFALEEAPAAAPPGAVRLELDAAALARKASAALEYREVHEDVRIALESFGPSAFAVESLWPATTARALERFEREAPAYERYGEFRVREGRYRQVIRFHEHVLPALRAIDAGCRA